MGGLSKIEDGGRVIAGLLGYNPGPGLYSRMSRAVEQMPKVIRTQELPGLLRKYPEGVPGWEVKAVAPALEGVESIPRSDLLDLIQQHSPAYTHKEVVLGGKPQQVFQPEYYVGETPSLAGDLIADFQRRPSPLGAGVAHARPAYESYGQGGQDYSELLLLQPGARGVANDFSSHWPRDELTGDAVAHARFDTHGDALRINELQSDLGIHNRKAREAMADFIAGQPVATQRPSPELPFPLEDAWADILIKRLALEAARGGHRAIEVASPRAIADKVGGNIDNYEHFYGKVVPGAIERLGRKMGGMTPDDPRVMHQPALADAERALSEEMGSYARAAGEYGVVHPKTERSYRDLMLTLEDARDPEWTGEKADELFGRLIGLEGRTPEQAGLVMTRLMELAGRHGRAMADHRNVFDQLYQANQAARYSPGRRYIMSDEMRRRILQQGIGLGVLGPLLGETGTNLEE